MPLNYPSLDQSIGQAEGYGKPGTIPTLAHNPGDIIAGPFATSQGAIGSITAAGGQQIAVFKDDVTGLAATDVLASSKINSGYTDPQSFAQSWLGQNADPADVTNWASVISSNFPGATNPAATSASGTPTTSSPGIISKVGSAILNYGSQSMFGLPLSGAAAFILGLIVLGGAIFLFKPAQKVIVSGARRAGEAVAV